MPRNLQGTERCWLRDRCGWRRREASQRKVPQRIYRPLNFQRVRVKRRGKSPPLQAQARRHGKPHRVQGQIGDRGVARSNLAFGRGGPGYWLLRQMILSARKGEDKIRLTALPKSF